MIPLLYIGVGALGGGVIACFFGIKKTQESALLGHYTPVPTIANIPDGVPIVVSGIVNAQNPLQSPFTQKPCVYYHYLLEREVQRKSSNGSTTFQWETVTTSPVQSIPFYLQDSSGIIMIKPDNCEVNNINYSEQFLNAGSINSAANAPEGLKMLSAAISMTSSLSGNRERAKEYAIFMGSQLNAFGFPSLEENQKVLMKTAAYPLVLSTKTKDQLVSTEKKYSYILFALAVILCIAGVYCILHK